MKTLFILNGPSGNRGCEAIMLSTYDVMKQAYPQADFVNATEQGQRDRTVPYLQFSDMKHRPHPTLGLSPFFLRWQIAKRFQGHEWNFERFVPDADIVMSLGGDNYSMDYDSIEKHLASNDRVVRAGKKLVVWGASVGPFEAGSHIEAWAKRSIESCHAVIVRENLSRDYLAEIGVTANVHVMPDPAFSLTPDPVLVDADIEAMLVEGAIGFNVSPLLARYRKNPTVWPTEAGTWLKAIVETTDAPILLIPHVMYQGNDDYEFLSKVLEAADLGDMRSRVALIDARAWSSRNLKYLIGRLRAFIGARTHATIAGMSQGIPTLSIGYSVKARGINIEVFGTDKWVVDHKTLTADALVGLLGEMLAAEDELRAHLTIKNQTYKMDPVEIRKLLGGAVEG